MTSIDSQLAGMKAWAKSGAETIAEAFGLTTVYGWRSKDPANTVTGHAAGLAADFPVGSNVDLGNRLAAFVQQNAAALGVQYVIWQQRMWRPGTGWTAMARQSGSRPGYDPNHERHVHVSWNTTPPAAGATITPASSSSTGAKMNPLSALNPATWSDAILGIALKVVVVVGGISLVVLGSLRALGAGATGVIAEVA